MPKNGVPPVKSGTVIYRLCVSAVHRDSETQQQLNVALEVSMPKAADRRRALSVDL